jgi:FKBP-type peptidyl-prolyl cis-trans isomerase FklB
LSKYTLAREEIGDGEAHLVLYDDGWRVESVKVDWKRWQGNDPSKEDITKSRERLAEPKEEDITKSREGLAEKNLAAGKAFMADNRKKEGVSELSNGLQYRVIKAGSGQKPKVTDTVSVHYRGMLINGRDFDSSERAGKPVSFRLNSVIKGWQEALPLMPEGSRWQVVIPPELAYGEQGAGVAIGPNETLVFDIELVGIGAAKDK